jgi:hypothetical protein
VTAPPHGVGEGGRESVTSHLRSDGIIQKMIGRSCINLRVASLGGSSCLAGFRTVLRLLCTSILMLVALPAAAEQRVIQSGLTKPFPAIGDAVVGCRDPADTVHWIEIITGKTWEREIIQDGQRQILHPSLRDVAIGVRGFFHAYIRTGDCWGYDDGDKVTIEAHGRWYDIDMMCASDPHGVCYWIPSVDLQDDDEFGASRR